MSNPNKKNNLLYLLESGMIIDLERSLSMTMFIVLIILIINTSYLLVFKTNTSLLEINPVFQVIGICNLFIMLPIAWAKLYYTNNKVRVFIKRGKMIIEEFENDYH